MRTAKLSVESTLGERPKKGPCGFGSEEGSIKSKTVLDHWYDPEHVLYKVRADDENLYTIGQQTSTPDGQWELVSFRQIKTEP
jgi:hypothetical protein